MDIFKPIKIELNLKDLVMYGMNNCAVDLSYNHVDFINYDWLESYLYKFIPNDKYIITDCEIVELQESIRIKLKEVILKKCYTYKRIPDLISIEAEHEDNPNLN